MSPSPPFLRSVCTCSCGPGWRWLPQGWSLSRTEPTAAPGSTSSRARGGGGRGAGCAGDEAGGVAMKSMCLFCAFPAQLPRTARVGAQVQLARRAPRPRPDGTPLGCLRCQTKERQCRAWGEPRHLGTQTPLVWQGAQPSLGAGVTGGPESLEGRPALLPGTHPALLSPRPGHMQLQERPFRIAAPDTHMSSGWETRVQTPRPEPCAPDRQWPSPSPSASCGFYRPGTAGPWLTGKKGQDHG